MLIFRGVSRGVFEGFSPQRIWRNRIEFLLRIELPEPDVGESSCWRDGEFHGAIKQGLCVVYLPETNSSHLKMHGWKKVHHLIR